jgi:hypothetical protein
MEVLLLSCNSSRLREGVKNESWRMLLSFVSRSDGW